MWLEERDCGARQLFCQLVALMFPHSEAVLNQLPQVLCGTPPPTRYPNNRSILRAYLPDAR
jgi:hypothetical protein